MPAKSVFASFSARRAALLFAVLALLPFLLQSGADAAELKYKFKKGNVEKFRETRILEYEFAFLGADQKAVTEEELAITETTEKIEEGNAFVKMQTSYIKMTENGEAVPKSETPDETFYYSLSPRGRTLAVLDGDKKPEKYFDAKKEKDLLPAGDVAPGAKWQGLWSFQGELCKAEYTLEKIITEKGVKLAVIKIAVEDELDMEEGDIKARAKVKGGGTMYFAIDAGEDILTDTVIVCDLLVDGEPFAKNTVKIKNRKVEK
ncbi:MAG: hypothetical protein ILO36_00115 [Abditibacteriota bacterium]|nr:hypothetical protein [Abditibacteriota bacterium]